MTSALAGAMEIRATAAPLASSVRAIWSLGAETAPPAKSLPDGCVDLIFHLGEPRTLPQAMVVGVMTEPLEVPNERVARLGVSLAPGEALAFLGAPVWELKDRTVELRALWGVSADELLGRLRDLSTGPARVALLERALARRLARAPCSASGGLVRAALARIDAQQGRQSTGALARALAVSQRRLERAFRERVGLSPKMFSRIARVMASLARLGGSPPPSWAEFAGELGFADQAHMVNEFRRLLGSTPGALLRSGRLSGFFNHAGGEPGSISA